jgi:hypothetical protein
MSFFNTIIAFKGALLGALLGNHLTRDESASRHPQGPAHASHCHRPHVTEPDVGHTPVATPSYGKPHVHVVDEYQQPCRPSIPLFSLSR